MIIVEKRLENGQIVYRDAKRSLWILSVLTPILPGLIAVALFMGASPLWSLFPILFYFGAIPLLDMVFGEDANNPPEEAIEQLVEDQYYRILLFISVPVFYFSFIAAMIAIGTMSLPFWSAILLAISAGISSGTGLTVAHELGHKLNKADQLGAKLILALSGYGHFCIEHNRGHHLQVATPEDPASAKMGESIYAFMLRELPGTAKRGIATERKRLEKKELSFWSWQNDLLHAYGLAGLIAVITILAFGIIMLPFLLLHHFAAWLMLTLANYVEHYGLKREQKPDGRHAPCEPRHSWNTNHVLSNLMLFHLQRHSDHHTNPMRPYQALRNFDDLPKLPSGYPGSFVLAAIPPLWFRVMDIKVMAWAKGDIEKTNHLSGYQPKM